MIVRKLIETDLENLFNLTKNLYPVTKEKLKKYCTGNQPESGVTNTYGVFVDGKLVSIMTASFINVFPHIDNPNGNIVHLSGGFTLKEYRRKGYFKKILQLIENEARIFNADYMCCDCTEDGKKIYISQGFVFSEDARLWKVIN